MSVERCGYATAIRALAARRVFRPHIIAALWDEVEDFTADAGPDPVVAALYEGGAAIGNSAVRRAAPDAIASDRGHKGPNKGGEGGH